jgi:multimeric flavodoxin WrbA
MGRRGTGLNGTTESDLVAILGSPRRGGNSDTFAKEFLRGARASGATSLTLIPTDLGISPCDGDNRCFAGGKCVIRDGMNEIYDRILAANRLLVATPVYFMGPPGSLKCFMDRFQAVWARANILKTFDPESDDRRKSHRAFAIFTGAVTDKPSYYRPAVSIVKAFLNVAGFEYSGEIIATGLEGPGDADGREDLLELAYSSGKTFVTRA